MTKIRTRFAPSPTGRMHVGNLRTALYAYLITKHEGGDFILRIEDTDQERYVEGAVDIIYRTLEKTGLLHDEGPDKDGGFGPYVQSERQATGMYLKYAKQLIEQGDAYYCFCGKEELESMKRTVAGKEISIYDKRCLHLSREEVQRRLDAGEPHVIRFNTVSYTHLVGLIFSAVFQTRHGTINNILNLMGIANIQWLGKRGTAVFAICVAEVWRNVGYAIIITLAGLQSVSSDYLEAGKLDGASEWQLFRHITLPLIMPTVNVNILFSLIYGLKMFDLIYVMTGGGPGNATESFGTLMMNEMSAGRYSQSVAVNLVFTVLLVIVSVVYQKFSSRWETVL